MYFASKYVLINALNKARSSSATVTNYTSNVLAANFEHLEHKDTEEVGDSIECSNEQCKAILSSLSQIKVENGEQIWTCEFCSTKNKVKLDEGQKPRKNPVTYRLEGKNDPTQKYVDDKHLVFCVDVSGSMTMSTEVDDSVDSLNIRDHCTLVLDECKKAGVSKKELENAMKNKAKYVTRLDCTKFAIQNNLNGMDRESPFKRVSLVAFSDDVRVIGDGQINDIYIQGNDLNDKTAIENKAKTTPNFVSILNSKENLLRKLQTLEENGCTALGPALYYSVLIACKRKNSQVILCTDGLANVGLGSLDDVQNKEAAERFYDEIAKLALSKGVSVSIIAIEGDFANLELLGKICQKTGGNVNVVSPFKLINEFKAVVEKPIIATGVEFKLVLHKALYIKNLENPSEKLSCIVKKIGNATKETELTFEFENRNGMQVPQNIPFQLQITYTDFEGTFSGLRVFTQTLNATTERAVAEKDVDLNLLAAHGVQNRANLIQKNASAPEAQQFNNYVLSLSNGTVLQRFRSINQELDRIEHSRNNPQAQQQHNDQDSAKIMEAQNANRNYFNKDK